MPALDVQQNKIYCFGNSNLPGKTKETILGLYKIWARPEDEDRKEGALITGYDTLIPQLENTGQEHICISVFITPVGSYIVFSDFERTDLIGLLLSKTSLQKVIPFGPILN